MAGKQSIYEGIHQISKGDLTYKIDTSSLQGETCEMAKAVNEMGDGLQQAVDSIVKNERLKAELITNVSHDIKTPLTSIVNYVDLLKRENIQGERVQQYLEVLDQKSQRLRQLTEDLVEASKITSGNIELHLMKLSLQSMWQQAYGEFQERFEEHGLILVCTLDKEPVHIMADGRQLWRILENLLGNICKYAMENTRVYVELYREDRTAYLSLQNTAREHLTADGEELTGRFVRGDKSRNTEGSGLGLSIAQSLVQLHGGTFSVTVEDDTFHVNLTFPVVAEDDI
jgi:signal transduction histidine kinase